MAEAPKYLFMVSQKYPYGKGEVYLERELQAFSTHYDKVVLMPLDDLGLKEHRSLPENVELSDLLLKRPKVVNKKYFVARFFMIMKILTGEMRNTQAWKYVLKNYKEFAGQLIMAMEMAEAFQQRYLLDDKIVQQASFYSVWLDEGAAMFALLKRRNEIPSFVVRLHGYDLYEDRREGNYMPFRHLVFKHAKRVFIVSKAGYDYLKGLNKFPEKLAVNYSGIYDHGLNPLPEKGAPITLLSVSNMVALKRIPLIMETLQKMKQPVKWIHVGDGVEREKLEKLRQSLPDHITTDWKGAIPFQEIIHIYQEIPIHAFIHLSETEGLPMAIVEAQSFGIPAIATDVGGTNEILHQDDLGILLDAEVNIDHVVTAIQAMQQDYWCSEAARLRIKNAWRDRFDAVTNYAGFVKALKE